MQAIFPQKFHQLIFIEDCDIISLWYNEYMVIHEIIWPADRVEHVAAHNITPEEFEEVCFGQPLILRTKSSGQNPVYQVLGQTAAGHYLLCIVVRFPDGRGYPVTARPMTPKEERRYRTWKR